MVAFIRPSRLGRAQALAEADLGDVVHDDAGPEPRPSRHRQEDEGPVALHERRDEGRTARWPAAEIQMAGPCPTRAANLAATSAPARPPTAADRGDQADDARRTCSSRASST